MPSENTIKPLLFGCFFEFLLDQLIAKTHQFSKSSSHKKVLSKTIRNTFSDEIRSHVLTDKYFSFDLLRTEATTGDVL